MKKYSLFKGFTLVELLIASAVFATGFTGILVSQNIARSAAENSLVKWSALNYSKGLLEVIQSYNFHEPTYGNMNEQTTSNNAALLRTCHSAVGTFSVSESGIYNSDSLIKKLSEESISLRYFNTSPVDDPNRPFNIATVLQNPVRYIGPDINDCYASSDPLNGKYIIDQADADVNIFQGNDPSNADNPYQLSKYYFCDDVDDFDGYTEVRSIFDKVKIKFTVSVSAVFCNRDNLSGSMDHDNNPNTAPWTYTINQQRYSVMQDIIVGNPMLGVAFPQTVVAAGTHIEIGRNFYQQIIFKKVSVRAEWIYPEGSDNVHSIVLDGGVVDPEYVKRNI